ncbi:MAG: DUF72 domain-containing protein [Myxococcota bacterium]
MGTSGWDYPSWRETFYPPSLPRSEELRYLAARLSSVEVDCTFYGSQRPATFARWYESTPADFVFALKGPRTISHHGPPERLHGSIAHFFSQGLLCLREKLGPILWQFPAHEEMSLPHLEAILAQLPRTHAEAHALSDAHALSCAPVPLTSSQRPIRYAVEVRSPSVKCAETRRLCKAAGVALVFNDAAAPWPRFSSVTTDFMYARLHGSAALYASRYEDEELEGWAERVHRWRLQKCSLEEKHPLEVYLYFNNDAHGHAPHDALRLSDKIAERSCCSPRVDRTGRRRLFE